VVTAFDPFIHDDAAYVLGALSPEDTAAFELHLDTCDECRARVAEIRGIPAVLAGLPAKAFEPLDETEYDVPDTLMPLLIREVRRTQRRRRILTSSLMGVAAASVLALVIAVWPSSSPAKSHDRPLALAPLVSTQLTATATLDSVKWGTKIHLTCTYGGTDDSTTHYPYSLVVIDKQGVHHELGTWQIVPGESINYDSGTSLTKAQIASVQITSHTGQPILVLNS
jgi:Putative zinc-finger